LSSGNSFASGAKKRKQKAKLEAEIKKISKITKFFPDQLSSAGARTSTEAPASPAEVKSNLTGNDDETDPNSGDAAADPTYIDAESSSTPLEALSTAKAFVSVPSSDPALRNTSDSKLVDYWIHCGP